MLWALISPLTCGYGTPFSMAWAAAKTKSTMLALAAALYAIPALVTVVSVLYGDTPEVVTALSMTGMALGNWIGGTLHSFLIRTKVFPPPPPTTPNDMAVAQAQQRRALRDRAREIAENDPALAVELRIGRPDLPRNYDDGGLIDMNHAPEDAIATMPGMTPELVEQIIEAREVVKRFSSAEELSITANLPVTLHSEIAEFSIFLP